jgi:hypothetical protein
MRQHLETLGGEGVDDGACEENRADQLQRPARRGMVVIVRRIMNEGPLFHLLMRIGWSDGRARSWQHI